MFNQEVLNMDWEIVYFIGLAYHGKDIVFRFIIDSIVAWGVLAPS